MNYAIVQIGGKQYKVTQGQEITVDKQAVTKDTKMNLSSVLMVHSDEEVLIGNPYVSDAVVTAKVIGDVKGDKIRVSKFKAKVHYRRSTGFRPQYTKILIEKISLPARS